MGDVFGFDPGNGEEIAGGTFRDLARSEAFEHGESVVHGGVHSGWTERDHADVVRGELDRPSSSWSESGSSPASIKIRRKKVEQMRQSVAEEIA